MKQITVSASSLGFDFEKCPRCFYLESMTDLKNPSLPPSAIFNKISSFMRTTLANKTLSTVTDSAPDAKMVIKGKPTDETPKTIVVLKSDPMAFKDLDAEIIISCRLDCLIKMDDGSYGIMMLKSSDPSEVNLEAYSKQLHAGAYALTHAVKAESRIPNLTNLGIMAFNPIDYINGTPVNESFKYIPVEYNPDMFENYLRTVAETLVSEKIPDYTPDCPYCKYAIAILARQDDMPD